MTKKFIQKIASGYKRVDGQEGEANFRQDPAPSGSLNGGGGVVIPPYQQGSDRK